jgi:hypothetical protein
MSQSEPNHLDPQRHQDKDDYENGRWYTAGFWREKARRKGYEELRRYWRREAAELRQRQGEDDQGGGHTREGIIPLRRSSGREDKPADLREPNVLIWGGREHVLSKGRVFNLVKLFLRAEVGHQVGYLEIRSEVTRSSIEDASIAKLCNEVSNILAEIGLHWKLSPDKSAQMVTKIHVNSGSERVGTKRRKARKSRRRRTK